jgi:hypothetical protein
MDLLGEGKEWPEATVTNPAYWPVSAAADAACDAKDAAAATNAAYAAWSAAAATYAAVYAAYAAAAYAAAAAAGGDPILSRRRQRDTLLKLIKEAPMETN